MSDERKPEGQSLCPACKGTLVQENAPACPYCGHGLGGEALGEGPNAGRLAKMAEHEHYSSLIQLEPKGDDYVRGTHALRLGIVLVAVGAVILASTWGTWSLVRLVPGAVLVLLGVWRAIKGLGERGEQATGVLYRRPAIVTDRRSETAFNGWSGRVTYYFTLEFENGLQGEFRFPGRGWPHEPLARGATGLAYTRGNGLLEFHSIKV